MPRSSESIRAWNSSLAGQAAKARYRKSAHGKKTAVDRVTWYQANTENGRRLASYEHRSQSPAFRAKQSRGQKRYRQTPNGRAVAGAYAARRTNLPPGDFADVVREVHALKPNCTKCSTPYKPTFQVDHIIPLAEGGTNNRMNLQPLCHDCHRAKTNIDVSRIAHSKR